MGTNRETYEYNHSSLLFICLIIAIINIHINIYRDICICPEDNRPTSFSLIGFNSSSFAHHKNKYNLSSTSLSGRNYIQSACSDSLPKPNILVFDSLLLTKFQFLPRCVLMAFWSATSRNARLVICAQRRFRSACAFAQADQNLDWAHFGFFSCGQRRLIRLHWCVDWFESSLGAHSRRYVFSRCGSFHPAEFKYWDGTWKYYLSFPTKIGPGISFKTL